MTTEQNKAVLQRLYEDVHNKRNIAPLEELVARDFIEHDATPGQPPGLEGLKQFFSMLYQAFPDFHVDVEFMVAEEDMVVSRIKVTGTHKGELMGIPATGKKVTFTGMGGFRIKNGKIVEHWENHDIMGLMQQLGVGKP